MVFADDIVRTLLSVGLQVEVREVNTGQALLAYGPSAFEHREGRRGSLSMWTSLGAKPVAALNKLLFAIRREGAAYPSYFGARRPRITCAIV